MIKDIVPEGVLMDRMKIQDITKPLLNRYVKLLKDFYPKSEQIIYSYLNRDLHLRH